MALTPRFLLVLFSLLPLAAHAQTSLGPASSSSPSSAPILAPQAPGGFGSQSAPQSPSFGNQAPNQGFSTTPSAPTATDPRAPAPRPGTTADDPSTQRRQSPTQPGQPDTAALPQLEPNEFQTFVAQSTGRLLPRNAIARNFRNFDLSVSLGQLRSIQIFIVGQAR